MDTKLCQRGITLIEIILAVALVAILGSVVLVSLNPIGQIGQSRNTSRTAALNTILLGVNQNMAENKGVFTCTSGPLPTSSIKMATGAGGYNIAPCLVPTFLSVLPFDPSLSGAHYTSVTDYDTGFTISRATSGVVTLVAPGAEFGKVISVSR